MSLDSSSDTTVTLETIDPLDNSYAGEVSCLCFVQVLDNVKVMVTFAAEIYTREANIYSHIQMVSLILGKNPGGAAIIKEYEDSGGMKDSSRRLLVNMVVAHMTEIEG